MEEKSVNQKLEAWTGASLTRWLANAAIAAVIVTAFGYLAHFPGVEAAIAITVALAGCAIGSWAISKRKTGTGTTRGA
jgi:hypothetical protein